MNTQKLTLRLEVELPPVVATSERTQVECGGTVAFVRWYRIHNPNGPDERKWVGEHETHDGALLAVRDYVFAKERERCAHALVGAALEAALAEQADQP